MPKFSAFTRFGHLRFSSRPAHGETIYADIVERRGAGKNFSAEWGSGTSGRFYAEAMQFARARYCIDHAGTQFQPLRATEMLPKLEWEYGLVPGPNDTLSQRRSVLAAAAKLAGGSSFTNVVAVLMELLGDDFIAISLTAKEDLVQVTTNPASVGNWVPPGTPTVVGKFTSFVTPTVPASLMTAPVQVLSGDSSGLHPGAKIVIDLGDWNRTEVVTLTAFSPTQLSAVFTKPHNVGTAWRSGRTPNLSSTKRQTAFVLSAAAMQSAEKRRIANRTLAKLLKGVSTWSLVEATDAHTAGPFTVGHGRLGHTPIGALTF